MKLLSKFLSIILFSSISLAAIAESIDSAYEGYKKYGLMIVDMVNANNIDLDKIKEYANEQTKYSSFLVMKYQEKFPKGAQLLSAALDETIIREGGTYAGLGKMVNMSFSDIESEWHDLGILTKQDLGIDMNDEDNEHFTDPLHVLLHPVMTLRAAMEYKETNSEEMKEAIKAETMEGLEQAEIVYEALK